MNNAFYLSKHKQERNQMEGTFTLPLVPVTERSGPINCVVVSVHHDKSRKQVVVSFYPGYQAEGKPLQTLITAGSYYNLEEMGRLNRKRISDLQYGAKICIREKNGRVYESLMEYLNATGYVLA